MKALVYEGPGQRGWDSVPDPTIVDPTDIVVRIETPTICGSDLHILAGDVPETTPGRVLGHGPRTALHYAEVIQRAGTVFWNGPMGVFELVPFANGTTRVAEAVATTAATTVAGGARRLPRCATLGDQIDHVSTGGGATLELTEGRELPGVQALINTEHIPALAGAPGSRTPT